MGLDNNAKKFKTDWDELEDKKKYWLAQLNGKTVFSEISLDVEHANQVNTIPQDAITGDVELTPVQRWFFEQRKKYLNHYSQAVMLYNKTSFDQGVIKKVFKKLVTHHDALRMVYKVDNDAVVQHNNSPESELYTLEIYDIRNYVNYKEKIQYESSIIQKSMDLKHGPLIKLALFKAPDGEHLLIAIHQLVVDKKSWLILLEDINTGIKQALLNESIRFKDKTTSFKNWASRVKECSKSMELRKEFLYWQEIEKLEMPLLPKDNYTEDHFHKSSKTLVDSLSQEDTGNLLTQTGRAYNTDVRDLLVTALGMTVERWTGISKILVMLEGDGRKDFPEDMNLDRTVGWFNSIYPFAIDMKYSDYLPRLIKTIKESLRHIPGTGMGYGILKYLGTKDSKDNSKHYMTPEINFRYMGQLACEVKTDCFTLSEIPSGDNISPNLKRRFTLDIAVMIINERLTFSFNFSKREYSDDTIVRLMNDFKEHLLSLINHCMKKKKIELTPSDFGNKVLSVEEFENIKLKYKAINKIHSLSPIQEAILFHSLSEKDTQAYLEQFSFHLRGDMDIHVLSKSYEILIERQDILRTVIAYEKVKKPQQIVFPDIIPNSYIMVEDLSSKRGPSQSNYVEKLMGKEREKGFDLSNEMSLRVILLKLEEGSYKMIWSFHHILMNSWCIGVFIKEFFSIYNVLKDNKKLELKPVHPFSNYLGWMDIHDDEEVYEYWKNYIAASKKGTSLARVQFQSFSKYCLEDVSKDLN